MSPNNPPPDVAEFSVGVSFTAMPPKNPLPSVDGASMLGKLSMEAPAALGTLLMSNKDPPGVFGTSARFNPPNKPPSAFGVDGV